MTHDATTSGELLRNDKANAHKQTSILKSTGEALWLHDVMCQTLTDCVKAQRQATERSLELIEHTAFHATGDRSEPIMVSFSLQMDGEPYTLRVPLLMLVPLPFLQISQADLTFYVNVMSDKCYPQQKIKVRLSPSNEDLEDLQRSEYVRNNIRVNIKAYADAPTGGMARLLQLAGTRCLRIRKVDE